MLPSSRHYSPDIAPEFGTHPSLAGTTLMAAFAAPQLAAYLP
jgi:hypothetical protein